jgi:L-lysine exporter family protein LysE/ArgO
VITLLAGLGFGLGLIVAIGAQNAYVLRQGIRREHVGLVVAVCAVSDVLLITVGAAGVGGLIARHTAALTVVTALGAVVLLGSVSATYAAPWLFALGAAVASICWFTALGFGARLLAPVFGRPGAWRIFDVAVAVVMTSIAVKLLLGLMG